MWPTKGKVEHIGKAGLGPPADYFLEFLKERNLQANRDYLRVKGGFPYRDPFAGDGIEAGDARGSAALRGLRQVISSYSALNEFRIPPGGGNERFIEGAKHTWGLAHE